MLGVESGAVGPGSPVPGAQGPADAAASPWPAGPDHGFLTAVLNNLSEALVACDADGVLTLFNPAARELHGLPAVPLPAQRWAQYYDLYEADGVTPMQPAGVPLLRALRGEPVRDVEMVVAPVGRAPRTLLASGQQLRDGGGRVSGAVVVMHDVTAGRAAAAADVARLRAQEQGRAAEASLRRLQQLNAAALAVNRQRTVDGVLRAITEQAAVVIGAAQAVTSLTRGAEGSQAVASAFVSERAAPGAEYDVPDGSGTDALVCGTGTTMRLTQDELERHPRWRGFGAHAAVDPPGRGRLAAPLVRRDGSDLGVVQLSSKLGADGAPADFDGQDEAALVQLAQVASLALEKAVEFAREHEVAVELQRSMLPRALPTVAGLDCHAAYVPGCDEADLTVGGDFYDLFEIDAEHTAVALGDVMGHGLFSASLMGQIRSALRALALLQLDPVEVVTALDRVVATLGAEAMATLAYGVLHVPSGRLRLVLAGHPPPLLHGAGGVEQLGGEPGLPLGALPGLGYVACDGVVEPGSTLLLYSDGLVETRSRPLHDGIDLLSEALAAGPADLSALSDALLSRMTGGSNDDDVALLLLRRTPLDGS